MQHSHPQQILHRLYDFSSDNNSLLLAQFAVIGHIFKQVPMRTVLSNEVAVRDCSVYVFEANDIGMRDLLEDLYLIIEHFKTRGGVLLELDDLYGVLALVVDVLAAVHVAGVARTDLVSLLVVVVADCLSFVLEADHRFGGKKVAGRAYLT